MKRTMNVVRDIVEIQSGFLKCFIANINDSTLLAMCQQITVARSGMFESIIPSQLYCFMAINKV